MGDNFGEGPAFQLGKRAGLNDANSVADLSLIFLIMHVIFFRTFDDFVELWMGNTGNVFHDEGLFHFIGNDHANACFTEVDLCVLGSLAHDWNWLVRWQGLCAQFGRDGCENLSGFATHLTDASGVFQGARGLLETEVESFLLEFTETGLKLVSGKLAGLFGFGFGHGSDGY
jgi:hypothetical protein